MAKSLQNDGADWGYKIVRSAVDNFIREVDGTNGLSAYPTERERRERAEELIYSFLGKNYCLFYVRRQGPGQAPGEMIWEMIAASDRLPAKLKKIKQTLCIRAAVFPDASAMRILSIRLVPLTRGQADNSALPFQVRLVANNHQRRNGIPYSVLAQMATLTSVVNYTPTEDQLKAWKAFLKVEESVARSRQFCIQFTSHKFNGTRQTTFEIDLDTATLDGSPENELTSDNFWQRLKKARNEDIKLSESVPTGKNWRNSSQLGAISEIDPKRGTIRIKLERDLLEFIAAGNYRLPATGYLFFEAAGDINQIQRKKRALDDLNQGRSQNAYLGSFLFDASQARKITDTTQLQSEDLLLPSANPGQKAAVEAVLAAEDLVLIQGPPGTGKTTVIAEICYQIALRGGRTLIASQANLAVDNALSRLVHNPVIRAVRKGRAEKVGEEGQPFLEDRVIDKWLVDTADDCENNLGQRQENIKSYQELLKLYPRFTAYLKAETQFQQQQQQIQVTKVQLETEYQQQETTYQANLVQKNELASLVTGLEDMLRQSENIQWESPETVAFLPLLQPYSQDIESVKNFIASVRIAINIATLLGFECPVRGAFGLAVWLHENILPQLEEFQPSLDEAKVVALAISSVAESAQVLAQAHESLNQIYRAERQFLSDQQTFLEWESRKREVNSLIFTMKEWKSTASAELHQVLQNCQQTGEQLSAEMLQLPLVLMAIANSLNIQFIPAIYQNNSIDYIPHWQQLLMATASEIKGDFNDLRGKKQNFSVFIQQALNQVPLALSTSDRTQWQKLTKEFTDYSHLTLNGRRNLVETTQEFLLSMRQQYSKAWEPSQINSTLQRMTNELLESILVIARHCVLTVKTEAEQHLQQHPQQPPNPEQIAERREQVAIAQQDLDIKTLQAIALLRNLILKPLPEQIHNLAQEYLNPNWEQHHLFAEQIALWESRAQKLHQAIDALAPLEVLATINSTLQARLAQIEAEISLYSQQLAAIKAKIAKSKPIKPTKKLIAEQEWWRSAWEETPTQYKIEPIDLLNLEHLNKIATQFQTWQQQLEDEEIYLSRNQEFVRDWISRLRNPTDSDARNLRQIYLDNANVIGITCVQAANREFSEEFKSFDVVIVDEVSKATPPELLIPALKGKKLVLVGDHRQLPPMLDTSTLEEVALEIGSGRAELQFLEESLFKNQFIAADSSIKQMLTTQYRMHPSIMGAINQFYDGQLECGITDPDTKRAHHLSGKIIQPDHHLLWVETPNEAEFQEQQEGTSFYNQQEIDIIEKLCFQMEAAWKPRVANGEPKKEIAAITFYGAQLRKIDERLQPELFPSLQIRTGTVDRFQGMERPVVFVSMVRNNNRNDVGFAKKPERVNVAFSRAQELLIIIGCQNLFTNQPGTVGNMYSQIANVVRNHGGLIDSRNI
jgi:DNA polymerase III delta prime subunit